MMDPVLDANTQMRKAGVPLEIRLLAIRMAKDAARIGEKLTVEIK